jgi:F-type H+-transporting ATPase subunit beta
MANHDATGRVVQILGGVVDVEFPAEDIPELFEAIEVERAGKEPIVLEVQKHIGNNWVRTVAMDATEVQRGIRARNQKRSWFRRPSTLGRIFMSWKPDEKGQVTCAFLSIHRQHRLFQSSRPMWKSLKRV